VESATGQVEDLLRETRASRALRASARERMVELVAGLLFLAGAIALAVAAPSRIEFDPVLAAVLTLTYAAATRVRFEFAFGQTDLSLLVLVPMLFLMPAHAVPLAVVLGFLIGRLPDYVRGRVHPDRALNAFGDATHSLGPAVVLSYGMDGGVAGPALSDWPLYVLALAAMIACDAVAGFARAWAAHGVRPQLQARVLVGVYALDVMLAPVGLLAAFASAQSTYAFLLGTPLVWLLSGYAREREQRLTSALELSDQRERVLEAKLEAAQARADVLGAISHGLQTPLAGLIGLSHLLEQHGDEMPPHRRAEMAAALVDHAEDLRHLVRQTLDFQVLQAGGTLHADLATIAPGPAVREIVTRVAHGRRPIRVDVVDEVPPILADPARLRQIMTSLVDNACRHAPADAVIEVTVRRRNGEVAIDVADCGPGIPARERARLFEAPVSPRRPEDSGTGIGLYIARALAVVMNGDLVLASAPKETGAHFTVTLPAAPR
jgi:signal transduction histidine kinase